ncbi:class I SAM-dependent methyltransferase [uncultured Sphingomonas sp.]|uniref:class I SAM-dependent methyltransferase n=1 Tax=uncultured Sphingomonas sp. TaxID=158754 RepID=UPI0035CA91D1
MNAVSPAPERARPAAWHRRAVAAPFHRLLDRIDGGLATGAIEASLPDGSTRRLGDRAPGPVAIVAVHRWRALVRLATRGSVGWYEGWAAGDWSACDPVPLFDLFMRNRVTLGVAARSGGVVRVADRMWHRLRRNTQAGARRNVAAHYDLGNDFYREWLDETMSYSSAIFRDPEEPLEVAQRRKVDLLLDRLALRPGDGLTEIGCGWGFLAEVAARRGAQVVALTLSHEQKQIAEARIAAAGLSDEVAVTLKDYRDATGLKDAVVSCEMVEAVGERYWPAYLETIARVLKPGGRAAIQFIAIAEDVFPAYAAGVDFIQRYVFPGGMLLSEARFRSIAEGAGLEWRDRTGFGADYAETLRRWRLRFDAAVAEGRLPARFDARFAGLWRYYLMYCEGGFRGGGIDVAQVTLVKSPVTPGPTRGPASACIEKKRDPGSRPG